MIEQVTLEELLDQAREDYRTINRLRTALDAALQYVDPKDRDWIEGLVRDVRPASSNDG